MRNRILVPLLSCALLALLAAAVPSLVMMAQRRTDQMITNRTQVLDRIAELARYVEADESHNRAALESYVDRHHQIHGEQLLILDSAGRTVHTTGGLDRSAPELSRLLRAHGFTPPPVQIPTLTPWSEPTALMAVPIEVGNDLSGGMVVLQVDTTDARRDIRLAWLFAGAMLVLLTGVLVVSTSAWSRWIVRPVHRLDESVHRLGTGRPPLPIGRGGPPELRRLGASFAAMADALTATLEQQRSLIADTSHQLRNPVAAVRLRVDLLQREAAGADRRTLEQVQADLDRLENTIDRLLVLAELDHRSHLEQPGAVDDHEIVRVDPEQIAGRWAERFDEAGLRVVVEGDPVEVRATGVEEMIDNVLDNACKYAGAGQTVRIRTTAFDGRVRIDLEDSGAGIDVGELPLAGGRFWRSQQHSGLPGTGLGLSMVLALARASGGTVTLDRSDLGGLRVRIELAEGER